MFRKKYEKSLIDLEILIYKISQEHIGLYHDEHAGDFYEMLFNELIIENKKVLDALKWRITMLEDKLKDCENRVEIVIDPKDLDNFVSNRKKHNAK
jgi:hypothetical protein